MSVITLFGNKNILKDKNIKAKEKPVEVIAGL